MATSLRAILAPDVLRDVGTLAASRLLARSWINNKVVRGAQDRKVTLEIETRRETYVPTPSPEHG